MEDVDENELDEELMEDDEQSEQRTGLMFSVGHVRSHFRKPHHYERVGAPAVVYLTSVLEYLATEALELSGNVAGDKRKCSITPDHIITAFRNDKELRETLALIRIPVGGVVPHTSSDFFKCVLDEGSTAVQSNTFSFSSTAFCHKFHSFQKYNLLTDTVILYDGVPFHCHSSVVSSFSSYLQEKLLRSSSIELSLLPFYRC
ncbi:hypothetical protein GEMRC1_000660 [Eukaryota sp. GEM-RC1]